MAQKMWASAAFEDIKEGSLKKIGWPSKTKIAEYIRKHPDEYATVIRKLLLLRNGSRVPRVKALAGSIIDALHKEFRGEEK